MATPISGQSYYILSYGGALTLDLAGGSASDGTKCLGWSPHFDQSARNRVWTLHDAGAGAWKIINLQSKTALTLKNGSSDDGTPIVGSSSFDTPSQLWSFEVSHPRGQVSSYAIRNKASNTVMDLSGGGSKDGTPVIGWRSHGGWNQRWVLVQSNS